MGLREMNASRTREHLARTGMTLFLERGYDHTTMEDVAQTAEVGLSTLYRYFPTKEALGTAFLGDPGLMAEALAARPPEEPAEVALGHAVLALVEHSHRAHPPPERFREIVDANARLRGRVMEWLGETYDRLCLALAERRGAEPDDVGVGATAWLAVYVLLRVDEEPGGGTEAALDVMHRLAGAPVRTPLPPDGPAPASPGDVTS
jgi:AcrR family transcriptional regulator